MTSKKTTRRALFMSVMSLILCFAMLVGTTFAWFTDSVASGKNHITAGNLDVELYYKNDTTPDWTAVDANTNIFKTETLWEPGHTEVIKLKVVNEGTLALKYQLGINIASETGSVNKEGNAFKLSDYIYFGVADGELTGDRDAAVEAVKSSAQKLNVQYTKPGNLSNDNKEQIVTVVVYMPTTVDNAANYGKDQVVPQIDLGINLYATQVENESDSFGNDYDAGAELLPDWNGEAGEVPEEVENTITITTAGELAAFAAAVNAGNSYSGKTIVLANDLDLANQAWTPVGAVNTPAYFQGTFDGQNHIIYGLNVDKSTDSDEHSTAGLFGWIDAASATIKNVKISGATVKGSHWVGAVAGYMTGEISNCHVTNSTITGYKVNDDANGDKVGGVVGYMNSGEGKLDGNSVMNTTITGYRDVAGLAGAVAISNSVKNNSVSNVTVIYQADYAAEIVSAKTAVVVDDTNVATNVTIIKGTQVAEGVYEVGTRSYEITSAAGLMNVNTIIANTNTAGELNVNVKLMNDVDMSGYTWTPISTMFVNFNGNGHTIKNLTTSGERSGLYAYQGGGKISNLTLENVTSSGAQAGTFVGLAAGTIENCYLKGNNTVNWVDYGDDNEGIGAISGVISGDGATINATIDANATVTLNFNDFSYNLTKVDDLTGYLGTNGGTVTNNGTIKVNKSATVENTDGLTGAIADGASDITLSAGTYKMPSVSDAKEFTIRGTKDTVIDNTLGAYMDSSKVSFEGVTIKGSTGYVYDANGNKGSDYAALYTPNVTYTNCTFDGPFRIGRDGATFINCTFTNLGNDYVWTYGNDATFKNCIFETEGKALLIYSDGGSEVSKVVVENCTFNATKGAKAGAISNQNCAAIEIQNYGNGVNLTTSGNTIDDDFSGEWRIKTYHANNPAVIVNGTEYTSIAIDGKTMTINGTEVTVNQ